MLSQSCFIFSSLWLMYSSEFSIGSEAMLHTKSFPRYNFASSTLLWYFINSSTIFLSDKVLLLFHLIAKKSAYFLALLVRIIFTFQNWLIWNLLISLKTSLKFVYKNLIICLLLFIQILWLKLVLLTNFSFSLPLYLFNYFQANFD